MRAGTEGVSSPKGEGISGHMECGRHAPLNSLVETSSGVSPSSFGSERAHTPPTVTPPRLARSPVWNISRDYPGIFFFGGGDSGIAKWDLIL